jgi:hypothetical protein
MFKLEICSNVVFIFLVQINMGEFPPLSIIYVNDREHKIKKNNNGIFPGGFNIFIAVESFLAVWKCFHQDCWFGLSFPN